MLHLNINVSFIISLLVGWWETCERDMYSQMLHLNVFKTMINAAFMSKCAICHLFARHKCGR